MQTMVPVGADKVWAEDSGGDSPVLVLMHEHVGDSRMWDPIWPALTAAFRVIRGGCWDFYPRSVRSACRSGFVPGDRNRYLGFRVARVQSGR